MRIFDNPNQLPRSIIMLRAKSLDPKLEAFPYTAINSINLQRVPIYYVAIESTLSDAQVTGFLTSSLTPTETALLSAYDSAISNFDNLPNWATWTAQEASDNVRNAIFAGKTQAQVDTDITNLANTIAGVKQGLSSAAAQIIAIRGILENMAKAIVYIRDLVIKLRH